jgi:putative DNA primase/helicase
VIIPDTPDSRGLDSRGVSGRTLTDLGNAERFIDDHGTDARYCHLWGKWFGYDDKRWIPDDSGIVEAKMKLTVRGIYSEATDAADERDRKAIADHAKRSESRARIADALWLARSESGIPILPSELDSNPWLLNCENGTIDLRSGELREHRREDLITKLAPVEYNPKATAPTFEAFLKRILPSEALRSFVRRVVGYAATGGVSEEILTILHGTGANGKSTLINIILDALGDYAMQAAPDLLLAKRDSHPTELADLFGARFVASVETDDGRRLSEGLVKQLTGRDPIKARRMREDFWQFEATHTLFLATNHRPEVRGTDHAIWRRIKLVPFGVVIPEADQDKKLPAKLRNELPGILAWIVRGCLEYQRDGLGEPQEVKSATEGYRADMDVLAAFIGDCCVVHPSATAQATPLFNAYQEWCKQGGEAEISQRRFGQQLRERGFRDDRDPKTRRKLWKGIGLFREDEPPDDALAKPSKPSETDFAHKQNFPSSRSGYTENRFRIVSKVSEPSQDGGVISDNKATFNGQPESEQAAPSGRRGSEEKGKGEASETPPDHLPPSLAGAERPMHGTAVQEPNDACWADGGGLNGHREVELYKRLRAVMTPEEARTEIMSRRGVG